MALPELLGLVQAEYSALKLEQSTRITIRDNAVYAAMGAIAGLATVALSGGPPRHLLLLAIPIALLALGAVYISQDAMTSRIRAYVGGVTPALARQVLGLADGTADADLVERTVGLWEAHHREVEPLRGLRKWLTTGLLSLLFVGTSLASLAWVWEGVCALRGGLLVLWWVELIFVVLLQSALVVTTDTKRRSSPS